LVRTRGWPGADERGACALLGVRLRHARPGRAVAGTAQDTVLGRRAVRRDAHDLERPAHHPAAGCGRVAPGHARRAAAPRHDAPQNGCAARARLEDRDGALIGRAPVVRTDRLLELLLELTRRGQLLDDIGPTDQLT